MHNDQTENTHRQLVKEAHGMGTQPGAVAESVGGQGIIKETGCVFHRDLA